MGHILRTLEQALGPWLANGFCRKSRVTGILCGPSGLASSTVTLTLAVLEVLCVKSFLRFRTSLRRLCVWYIFSAATQDLGLLSGGMVIPYSQPGIEFANSYPKEMHLPDCQINFQKTSTLPTPTMSFSVVTMNATVPFTLLQFSQTEYSCLPSSNCFLCTRGVVLSFTHGNLVHLRIKHSAGGRWGQC